MLSKTPIQEVYLATGTTDLRKSIDGLAAIVQMSFKLDPFSSHLFVFCNRKRDKLKILHWDYNGFWFYYRRLEKGVFQWIAAFLKDRRLEFDKNRAELSIIPFMMGRKAWMFAQSMKGAKASAIIYSIVETAKENQLNPLNYLTFLFERLPFIDRVDVEAIDQLLPWSKTIPEVCRIPNKIK